MISISLYMYVYSNNIRRLREEVKLKFSQLYSDIKYTTNNAKKYLDRKSGQATNIASNREPKIYKGIFKFTKLVANSNQRPFQKTQDLCIRLAIIPVN